MNSTVNNVRKLRLIWIVPVMCSADVLVFVVSD